MLRRDEHALDLDRAPPPVRVLFVANGDLRLAVGTQIRQHVRLPHLGQLPRQPVREHDRQRHQLLGLVRRVAEHHSLIAGALLVERVGVPVLPLERRVHALRDVGRLLVDRDDHAARVGVEAELRARVPDLADPLAHQARDVHVRRRRDLAGHDDEAGGDQRLARHPSGRIVGEDGVEDAVRDLVGDLVRMSLGNRLRGERERAGSHG